MPTQGDGTGSRGTVVIMAKDPTALPVKTRLAASIGDEAARRLYRAFIVDEVATVERAGLRVAVSLFPPGDGGAFREWLGVPAITIPQEGDDLGERIIGSLSGAMAMTEGPVITITSDVPDLPMEHLHEALSLLDGTDAILASSSDGGFHIIGLRRHAIVPDLLGAVPWSTGVAMAAVRERLEGRGLSVSETTPWHDVDDGTDLGALGTRLAEGRSRAPATARVLAALGMPVGTGPWLSLILPVLHEEETIAEFLEHTLAAGAPGEMEVIVVDGDPAGSTLAAVELEGVVGITFTRGRGTQMNAGASLARGHVLLFLHADTRLPDEAPALVRQALDTGVSDVGAFTISYGGERMVNRMMGKLGNFRSQLRRMPYGDQAIFMTREAYDELGGFPDVPIMEDVEMMLRVKRSGREVVFIDRPVTTSARRFERVGFWRTNARNMAMLWMHRLGLPPEKLADFYPPHSEERPRWDWRPYVRRDRGRSRPR